MPTEETVLSFVDAINAHDVPRIVAMCAPDHQFIDACGTVVPAAQVQAAWSGYFAFMPQYGIEVQTVVCDGNESAVFGVAWGDLEAPGGTSRPWRRPAAWRAVVAHERVQVWQVYVDTKIVFDLLQSGSHQRS